MMTPAREVGGDLYGYVLLGDLLYFCVGDVSGKGVPAALYMAEVTNLKTGHMEFCNAGHNPPLLDGEFMKMASS